MGYKFEDSVTMMIVKVLFVICLVPVFHLFFRCDSISSNDPGEYLVPIMLGLKRSVRLTKKTEDKQKTLR